MKIRAFKTYSSDFEYVSYSLLPSITFEGVRDSDKIIQLHWLFWGIQFKWI